MRLASIEPRMPFGSVENVENRINPGRARATPDRLGARELHSSGFTADGRQLYWVDRNYTIDCLESWSAGDRPPRNLVSPPTDPTLAGRFFSQAVVDVSSTVRYGWFWDGTGQY